LPLIDESRLNMMTATPRKGDPENFRLFLNAASGQVKRLQQ
jgi:hypothetical protein